MFSASQNIKRLKEISYLKAIVFDHLSIQHHQSGESNQNKYTQERESAALEFVKLEKRLEMAKLNSVEPFFDFELTDSIRRVISHRLAEEE
ncbi:Anaphase-promoting complex subunit 5 [Globisporangium polare]